MSEQPTITRLVFERNAGGIGIGQSRPSLSWRYAQNDSTIPDWIQESYEIFIERDGKTSFHSVNSGENVNVPWPRDVPGLKSREQVKVGVRTRAVGGKGETEWYYTTVEAGLLDSGDWKAQVVGPSAPGPANLPKRPFHVSRTFNVKSTKGSQRIYATALGVYQLTINGKLIGDEILAPGWQSYNHRLHYQTYEIQEGVLVEGENTIDALVGEGWYAGRLTWQDGYRNIYGSEIGVQIQVEVDGTPVVVTDTEWKWRYGQLLSSELYDGEHVDLGLEPTDWQPTKTIPLPKSTTLIAPEAPPIRRTQEITPVGISASPTGKKIIDFGQNFVGWVKLRHIPKKSHPGEHITLRFAEVLTKDGEMGIRPLRSAKVTDVIYLADEVKEDWEPVFTTHGFRYCELTGPKELVENYKEEVVGVVVHSDMERIGDFECSHELVNQLHKNVVWGLRGNFVGVPTDCPQRDERLGWTGDLQAFTPTASFLYNTSGMLSNWLHDLSEEQIKDSNGIVPLVVPNVLSGFTGGDPPAQAVWGDVCVISPKDLYQAYGNVSILEEMFESMTTWLDKGIKRGENGLWLNERNGFQLSDWLDPAAPPDDPGAAMTDQFLVADAYLVGIAQYISDIAGILNKPDAQKKYQEEHDKLRKTFQKEYITPGGRLSSDTQTAYCMAFQFNLLDPHQIKGAAERLIRLARKGKFRISTGFAGTPGILHALTRAGHLQVAYRMLQEKGCPSWLYPVTMGATTIWERWDSMLPNGEINPGEMTSFNHYALGAVANWLHTTVAGLKPLSPGYKTISIHPQSGGSLTSASAYTNTPYGKASVSWKIVDNELEVEFEVPPNTTAEVDIGGEKETVGSGKYKRSVKYTVEGEWPPQPYTTQFAQVQLEDTLAL